MLFLHFFILTLQTIESFKLKHMWENVKKFVLEIVYIYYYDIK